MAKYKAIKKVYEIHRENGKVVVTVGKEDEARQVTNYPLAHVVYHSPDGFEFGYGGSGPEDLALSILADFFQEELTAKAVRVGRIQDGAGEPSLAVAFHQQMKRRFIESMDQQEGGEIFSEEIEDWFGASIQVAEKERAKRPASH